MGRNGDDRRPKQWPTRRHAPPENTARGRHAPPWPDRPFFDTATPFSMEILFWTLFSTGAKPKSASKASEIEIEKGGSIYLIGRRVFRRVSPPSAAIVLSGSSSGFQRSLPHSFWFIVEGEQLYKVIFGVFLFSRVLSARAPPCLVPPSSGMSSGGGGWVLDPVEVVWWSVVRGGDRRGGGKGWSS